MKLSEVKQIRKKNKTRCFSTDGSADMPLNLADQQQSAGGKQILIDGYQQSFLTQEHSVKTHLPGLRKNYLQFKSDCLKVNFVF